MKRSKALSLALFLLLVLFIEWVGYGFTITSVNDWYPVLQKPEWNPPSWVFGPIWTILYVTIAISGWLIFIQIRPCKQKSYALGIYAMQLFCNLCWPFFFFYLKNPALAFVDLLFLVLLIGMNIKAFSKLYRLAAILLIPYFLWSLYAAVLNAAIWSLNR